MAQERDARALAAAIWEAGVAAADPYRLVRAHLAVEGEALRVGTERFELSSFDRVLVLGAGKATAAMAAAAEDALEALPIEGLVVVKHGHGRPLRRVDQVEAGHPVPDAHGLLASLRLLALARSAGPRDLVLGLFSGGGSALLPAPLPGLSLEDMQAITRALLASGLDIHAANTLRRHLSAVGGGRLAAAAAPARAVALLLSDVPGDDPAAIASGPMVGDPTSWEDCARVAEALGEQLPPRAHALIAEGVAGDLPDTHAPGDPVLAGHVVIGGNALALQAAATRARSLGLRVQQAPPLHGEASEAGRALAGVLTACPPPACLLAGGETTVTLGASPGRGGRNQELALAAALALEGVKQVALLAAGTDGTDGPTPAAGGLVDGGTAQRMRVADVDPERALADHDALPALQASGDLHITGPTGTNVMDLVVGVAL